MTIEEARGAYRALRAEGLRVQRDRGTRYGRSVTPRAFNADCAAWIQARGVALPAPSDWIAAAEAVLDHLRAHGARPTHHYT